MIFSRIALAAVALLTLAVFPAQIRAAEPSLRPVTIVSPPGQLGALVAPVPVILTNSGDTGGQVRVDNISTLAEAVTITVSDYVVDADGKPVAAPADYPFGSSGWYRFEAPSFTLPPGTSRDVKFALVVPPDAAAGDHVAALNVTVKAAERQAAQAGATVQSVLVLQNRLQHRIAGAHPETPVLGLTATTDPGQVHFAARINNSGNTVLTYQSDPKPTLSLYDLAPWGNADAPSQTFAIKGFYVAPESERLVPVDWSDAPIIGRYRAVLTLPAADGLPAVTAETIITVVNAPVLVGIAGGVLSLLIASAILGRRRRRSIPGAPRHDGRPHLAGAA